MPGILGLRSGLEAVCVNGFPITIMSRICAITGKRPVRGGKITRKGQTKKSGGIGTHVVKNSKRTFRPNLQRVRVRMPNGQVKRVWVSTKALKAGKVQKA